MPAAPPVLHKDLDRQGLVNILRNKGLPTNLPQSLNDVADEDILEGAVHLLEETRKKVGIPVAFLGRGGRVEGDYRLYDLTTAQKLARKPPYWSPMTEEELCQQITELKGGR